jgi:hypothetical protein
MQQQGVQEEMLCWSVTPANEAVQEEMVVAGRQIVPAKFRDCCSYVQYLLAN